VADAPPKKSELRVIEGEVSEVRIVEHSSKYQSAEHPIIHLAGRSEAFVYLDWFTEPEKVGQALKAGDKVRLLSDVPRGNHWIWQLEKGDRTIVAYEQVLAAVRHNNRFDPFIALGLGLVGAWGLVRYFRRESGEKDDESEETVREESKGL